MDKSRSNAELINHFIMSLKVYMTFCFLKIFSSLPIPLSNHSSNQHFFSASYVYLQPSPPIPGPHNFSLGNISHPDPSLPDQTNH